MALSFLNFMNNLSLHKSGPIEFFERKGHSELEVVLLHGIGSLGSQVRCMRPGWVVEMGNSKREENAPIPSRDQWAPACASSWWCSCSSTAMAM